MQVVVAFATLAVATTAVATEASTSVDSFDPTAWVGVAVLGLVVLATLLLIARRVAPQVREVLAVRRNAHLDSEADAFARVERACRNNNAMAAYEALLAWCLKRGWPSLASCRRTHPDPALGAQIEQLEAELYSTDPATWNGAELLAALQRTRREAPAAPTRRNAVLPPLNL